MIQRPLYIKQLKKYRDVPITKVLAGIRRCGKSTLLELLKSDLIESGVAEDHIISLKYTSHVFSYGFDSKKMYEDIASRIKNNEKYYLLLDEVQEIENWEKVINSLQEDFNTDIYVTGSNSKLLGGEISTYLTGRYVSIPVFTLSFAEFLEFNKENSAKTRDELLSDYIKMGGFPILGHGSFDQPTAYKIVEDIYMSVVTRDIVQRNNITNFDLYNRVVKFIFENVGKTFSANAIVKYLKSESRSISVEAIYNYLDWLEKAFVIYRCQRYDLRGKAVLKTQEKFYLADPALKYCLMGFSSTSISSMLENIVYLELLRRGYSVHIGKLETKEIDFVASRQNDRIYVQVCRNMPENSDREISNLKELNDNYPKYVVTLDKLACGNFEGINIVHLADFLLEDF